MVPARADVGIRPYGEGRMRIQNRNCLHRGVEDAAPYKGVRLRHCTVGDGVLDVPPPRRSALGSLSEGAGTAVGRD